MRLVDLAPAWYSLTDGRRVGFSFACPVHAHLGLDENGHAPCALGRAYVRTEECGSGHRWQRNGDDFATMSTSPSVLYRTVREGHAAAVDDTHKCGAACLIVHWHGFVTNGDVSILPDSVKP